MSKTSNRALFPFLAAKALALSALTILLLQASEAHACGGFFCSQAAPVNQAAEQIIFSKNTDGTVTAVISIRYQGDAKRFAWVLPIAGVPTVGISSNLAFQRLLQATTPRYSLTQRVEGTCKPIDYQASGGSSSFNGNFSGGTGGTSSGGSGPTVTIVNQGSVGPYDFVAIAVSQDTNDPARVAIDWFAENQYDVTGFGEDVLASYLEDGLNLLAFRLTKGNVSGSIRPIKVTYSADYPAIPIRPTAVAANDDMGVMVYVVAEAQAIPKNYMSLLLNEALINWFSFASTYNAVISRAADESGGQGFVTEFGGPSTAFKQTIFSEVEQQNWQQLATTDFSGQNRGLYNNALARYGSWDGFREAVAAAITLPSNVTLDAFLSTPWLYDDDTRIGIDDLKFLTALQEDVIDPMIDTQKLLISRPYLTRLFTTLSADEMTLDPLFSINPDLTDVSNIHVAEQVIECSPEVHLFEAPWRIALPQGGIVRGKAGSGWPFSPNDNEMPANRKIVQLSESGSGDIVTDNSHLIWATLDTKDLIPNPSADPPGSGNLPIGGYDPMIPNDDQASADDSNGCSLRVNKGNTTSQSTLLLCAFLLIKYRRHTRARPG